jgi:hypothetical protein
MIMKKRENIFSITYPFDPFVLKSTVSYIVKGRKQKIFLEYVLRNKLYREMGLLVNKIKSRDNPLKHIIYQAVTHYKKLYI